MNQEGVESILQDELSDAVVAVTTVNTASAEQTFAVDEGTVTAETINQRAVKYEDRLVSENFIKVAKRSKAWLLAMNEQASLEPKERQVDKAITAIEGILL